MVKADIIEVFYFFFGDEGFEKSLNATFIALIPKKKGAVDL